MGIFPLEPIWTMDYGLGMRIMGSSFGIKLGWGGIHTGLGRARGVKGVCEAFWNEIEPEG